MRSHTALDILTAQKKALIAPEVACMGAAMMNQSGIWLRSYQPIKIGVVLNTQSYSPHFLSIFSLSGIRTNQRPRKPRCYREAHELRETSCKLLFNGLSTEAKALPAKFEGSKHVGISFNNVLSSSFDVNSTERLYKKKAGVYGPPPELPNRSPTSRSRLVVDKISKIFMKRIANVKPEICGSLDLWESGLSTTRHCFRYNHNLKEAEEIIGWLKLELISPSAINYLNKADTADSQLDLLGLDWLGQLDPLDLSISAICYRVHSVISSTPLIAEMMA
ncbi:hypothetical protein ACTXT7_008455 [Hymenolepis weldensis]